MLPKLHDPIDGYAILRDGTAYILYDKNLNQVGVYDTEWEAREAAKRRNEHVAFGLL